MKWIRKWWGSIRAYPAKFLQIYERDWVKLFYLSVLNFVMMMGNTIGLSIATSLLLKKVGIESLPSMYITNSLIIMCGSLLYLPFITKFKQTIILRRTFIVFSIVVLVARLGISFNLTWFYFVLYLSALLFTWVYYTQFWTLATHMCNIREGKRVFSLVVSAGLLGGGAGGLLTKTTVNLLHTDNMLFLWSASFLVIAVLMRYLDRLLVSKTGEEEVVEEKESWVKVFGRGVAEFRRSHLLKSIGLGFFLYAIVVHLLDFQFNLQIDATFIAEDRLTSFLGAYYGYFYAGTLLLVIVAVSRLIKAIGVGNVMLTLPIVVGSGFLFLNFNFNFLPVVVTKFLRDIIGNSLIESAYPLLFLPIAEKLRREALTFNESFIIPLGMFSAGIFIMLFKPVIGIKGLVLTGTLLSAGWIYYSLRMKKEYMSAFIHNIEDKTYFEGGDYLMDLDQLGRERSIELLKSTINDENEKASLFAMDMLARMGERQGLDVLLGFLKDKNKDARRRASAMLALGNTKDSSIVSELLPYIKDDDARIRANSIETIGRLDPIVAKELSRGLLKDDNSRVRTNAAVIHWKYGNREEGLEIMSNMMKYADSKNRVRMLYMISELGGENIIPIVEEALNDTDDDVKLYGVKALESVQGEKSVSLLIKMLSDKNRAVRRAASAVLEKMNGAALGLLLEAMKSGDGLMQKEISFILIKRRDPGSMPAIIDYCIQEIRLIYQYIHEMEILSRSVFLRDHPDTSAREVFKVITSSMKLKSERKLFKVLRLISAVEHSHAFTVAVRRLRDRHDPEARANAVEVIEDVIGGRLIKLLLPLLEDTTLQEKASEASRLWSFHEKSEKDILNEMSSQGYSKALKLCADYLLEKAGAA